MSEELSQNTLEQDLDEMIPSIDQPETETQDRDEDQQQVEESMDSPVLHTDNQTTLSDM